MGEKKKLSEKGDHAQASKLESKRPLHVGNVCHVAEERTIIHSMDGTTSDRTKKGEESFSVDEYSLFKNDNKEILDRFTEANWDQSRELLMSHGHILMDNYANSYYMLMALDEEMKGNRSQMIKVARQGQIISQIFQLAEPMKRPPRDLVPLFFERFEKAASQAAFQEGVDHFVKHLIQRAIDKKKEQAAEVEKQSQETEELQPVSLVEAMYSMDPKERMGPGGLDPVEVFESLPEELQACFKSGDVEMLKQVAMKMDSSEFDTHLQRCIDAGLWSKG